MPCSFIHMSKEYVYLIWSSGESLGLFLNSNCLLGPPCILCRTLSCSFLGLSLVLLLDGGRLLLPLKLPPPLLQQLVLLIPGQNHHYLQKYVL